MQIHGYDFAAVVGLDWADRKHDICLLESGSKKPEFSILEHEPKLWRLGRTVPEAVRRPSSRSVLELERGPIVSALLEHDIFVLFPIRPTALANYRKTFVPSGAKDDPTDAFLALDYLHRHPDQLAPLRPERPEMRALQRLVADRRTLVQDRTRILNRLTDILKSYFPQVLEWFPGQREDGLRRLPRPVANAPGSPARPPRHAQAFFHEHNVRRADYRAPDGRLGDQRSTHTDQRSSGQAS